MPRRLLALCAALVLAVAATAAEQERNYQISDAGSEALTKAKTAIDAKNYDEALRLLDAQLGKVDDKSGYEAAVIFQFKANVYLQKGEYSAALEPLERCLALSDSHSPTFFDERASAEMSFFLGQLYFQEATTTKNAKQVPTFYEKADSYLTRWLKATKKPTADNLLTYAQVIYNRAVVDADHPDKDLLKRVLETVDKAMHMTTRPKDTFYLLKLVCLQQLDRNAEATDILELLVKMKPDNKTYWSQLAALYVSANEPVRAIVTFERAQEHGLMNTPKDNFNLVGLHFNMQAYERVTDLLGKGLRDGTIEDEQKNWELLAYSYQQLRRDQEAINVLKEATKHFPQSGQLDYMIAQNYYSMEKLTPALTALQACVAKGGGNKPGQSYMFLAYIAFELKKFDIALDAVRKAVDYPESAKNAKQMEQSIKDAIAEREDKMKKM